MSVAEKRKQRPVPDQLSDEESKSELGDYYISPRAAATAKSSGKEDPSSVVKNQSRVALFKENGGEVRIEKLKEKLTATEMLKKRRIGCGIGGMDGKGVRIESGKNKGLRLGVPQCRYERSEVRAGNVVSGRKKHSKQDGKVMISKKNSSTLVHRSLKHGSVKGSDLKLESKDDLNGYKREKPNNVKCITSEFVMSIASPSKELCMNSERNGMSVSVDLPECPSSTDNTRSDEANSRRGDVSTSGSSIPSNKRIIRVNNGGGRNEVKRKVKDQIRSMLFDAGWSIELRPRRNRDYEDSVYVSPQGTTYWSITNAYAAFQEDQETNNKTIAMDELQMLKRKVRNRRDHYEREAKWSVRKRPHGDDEDLENYTPYEWKRTVLSWLIDQGIVPENSKVRYMNMRRNKTRLKGRIRRDGIYCSCCSKILSVHKFELHAGSKRKQAYENIYVEGLGVSLTQCLLDAWKKQSEGERKSFCMVESCGDDASDDSCGICGDGGDLICCDSCPSTFHMACLGIQVLPPGVWHCRNCSCKFCKPTSSSQNQQTDKISFALLACRQCGQKYHEGCIPEEDAVCRKSGSEQGVHNSFCGLNCKKLYKRLRRLLGVRNEIDGGYSWTIVRRLDERLLRYLQRLSHVAYCNSKIAVAYNVMDECFLPITDQRTGIELIHSVIYNCGSNFSRLDFSGFYTFILERSDEIISAASVRIHGTNLAEMPFIGTRNIYRRQGMCRRLLSGIESALCSLNVRKLIIPAISELKSTWTNVFGFINLDQRTHRKEISSFNLLAFPGTGLFQKNLQAMPSDEQHASAEGSSEGKSKENVVINLDSLFQKQAGVDCTLPTESIQNHQNGEQNMLESTNEMPENTKRTPERSPRAEIFEGRG